MIVVQIIGGLGNQLFQYAAAKALAIEKKQDLFLDVSRFESYDLHAYGLNHFKAITKEYKTPNKYIRKIRSYFKTKVVFVEPMSVFSPEVFSLNADDIFIKGYFQSEKYFIKYEKEIRNDFQITSPLKEITKDALKKIEKVNSVSLHIRRGDYLTNTIHNTDKEKYYGKAIEIIESKVENPVFFVFSDDMDWVTSNFKIKHPTVFIDFNDALTNYEDIKLMASCKHNIIANSSFSWWSAWLNENPNKIVLAPSQWFNDNTRDTKDIIPDSWIKV